MGRAADSGGSVKAVPGIGDEPADALSSASTSEDLDQLMDIMSGTSSFMPLIKNVLAVLSTNPRMQSLTKVMLIEMMGGLGEDGFGQIGSMDPRLGRLLEVLIEDRNRIVLHDLRSALNGPEPPRSVSIFYGAGHMRHFQKMLVEELHFVPVEEKWLTAFAVDLEKSDVTPAELQMVRSVLEIQKVLLAPSSWGSSATAGERDEGLIPEL